MPGGQHPGSASALLQSATRRQTRKWKAAVQAVACHGNDGKRRGQTAMQSAQGGVKSAPQEFLRFDSASRMLQWQWSDECSQRA